MKRFAYKTFIVAFSVIISLMISFGISKVFAEPESPNMVTDKPFVLRDNNSGREKDFDQMVEALMPGKAINGGNDMIDVDQDGDFTLYLMRNYDASNEKLPNNAGRFIYQNGKYSLTIRSAGKNTFTLSTERQSHFELTNLVKNRFKNIILDGKNIGGGLFITDKAHVTFEKGAIIQNCKETEIAPNEFTSPIKLVGKDSKLTINEGAEIKNNKCFGAKHYGIISADEDTIIEINGGKIYNNHAQYGGLIYGQGAIINIKGGIFSNNKADAQGGVIGAYFGTKLSVKNAGFLNNAANLGGAISASKASEVIIDNCGFKQNEADWGGGIYLRNTPANIKNAVFEQNTASNRSGGIHASSDVTTNMPKITVMGCEFKENIGAGFAGAVLLQKVESEISECDFINNFSIKSGGAVYLSSNAKLSIDECDFKNNGNARQNNVDYYTENGGAMGMAKTATVDIKKCNFIKNTAKEFGGAIYDYLFDAVDGDKYSEEQKNGAYGNLKTDGDTVFSDNKALSGFSAPPKNYADFTSLAFKSNSFKGKTFNPQLLLDKSLLNNYDVNFLIKSITFTFDSNGGKFKDGNAVHNEIIPNNTEYTISNETPIKDGYSFKGWRGEDGKLYQVGDKLAPATADRKFIAVWGAAYMPQTGDAQNIALYFILLTVAVISATVVIGKRRFSK